MPEMNASKGTVIAAFDKMKKLSYHAFSNKKYLECINNISHAAYFAYLYNFCFKDDDLEFLLSSLSKQLCHDSSSFVSSDNVYVMIDGFGTKNRGLSQQYLRAFAGIDVTLYYMSLNPSSNRNEFYEEVLQYDNVKLVKVNENNSLSKITSLCKLIEGIRPSKIFAHIAPWDSVTPVVLYNFKDCAARYNINLTDHAFWLGAGCFDYTIEFREYGCSISSLYRGFKREQILLNPFYPIVDDSAFEGFPNSVKGKLIFFTGGNPYKIYDNENTFLRMLKHILEIVPNAVILYAGSGNLSAFHHFVRKNDLQDKILFLGTRKDINQVFKHCDIYLDTYPFSGGLMRLYAAINSKPVMIYNNIEVYDNVREDVFYGISNNIASQTYYTLADYYEEIERLSKDNNYREEKGAMLKSLVITPTLFQQRLVDLLANHNFWNGHYFSINVNKILDFYLESNNNYIDSVGVFLFKTYNIKSFYYFPFLSFKYFSVLFKYALREIIKVVQ